MSEPVVMDGATLGCAAVAAVARRGARVAIAPAGLARAAAAHRTALELAARDPFYGRTTGVGANGAVAVEP
ncbi:aromatic amino acid lyase, partial [Trebonia sp.]|uniref:aromatic amino acid lyase n=1 Tax=Trebonia sp. TaxID=2767075 RepID=UPI00262363DF